MGNITFSRQKCKECKRFRIIAVIVLSQEQIKTKQNKRIMWGVVTKLWAFYFAKIKVENASRYSCRMWKLWPLAAIIFFLFFLPNKCYERISPGIHSTLRVKNMYRMETGRMLRLADSSALLNLLETFKCSRDEGVVFFRENQVTKKLSKSSEQLSHGSRFK